MPALDLNDDILPFFVGGILRLSDGRGRLKVSPYNYLSAVRHASENASCVVAGHLEDFLHPAEQAVIKHLFVLFPGERFLTMRHTEFVYFLK